jgi:membrane fusion protein (multidrug efflux system)
MKTDNKTQAAFRNFCLGILAATIIITGFFGCGQDKNGESNQKNKSSQNCVNVELSEVKTDNLEEIISGIGSTQAFQSVAIYPEVGGAIKSVHFDEGQEVKKGQLLFTIDDAKIQAELDARHAALEEAEANRENARLVFQRRQRLYEQKLGTEEARDQARAQYQALNAQVKRINAEIRTIKETLEDTKILAPFDGIMGEHSVDPGQVVDTGTELSTIVEIQRLKIDFAVPERYVQSLSPGQAIRIKSPGFEEKIFSGNIYFINPSISPGTRSLSIKARMDNPDNLLRPGGFVSVEVITGMRENVLVIPEEALIPTRTGYMVFTVENQTASGQVVEIGLRKPGIVEITKGLEKGQKIVRAGHISLYEGARICGE